MHFSFDYKKYRDNLADSLKTKRKEGQAVAAGEELASEKNSNEYKISESIHKSQDNRDLFFKESMRSHGFDAIDISDQIPDKISLFIDANRLKALDVMTSDKEIKKDFPNIISASEEFIDKITDGKYYDARNPNHVIGAYHGDLSALSLHTHGDKKYQENLTSPLRKTDKLWINFGKTDWLDPCKQLAIFSLDNPNFRRLLTLSIMMDDTHGQLGETLYNRIYKDKEDITTIEQIEEFSSHEMLKEINEKIESLKCEKNGEVYYELENGAVWGASDEAILPFLILKHLPIKVKNDVQVNGLYLNVQNLFSEVFDKNSDYFNAHPHFSSDKLSFATVADTIVDLPDKKIYKYHNFSS